MFEKEAEDNKSPYAFCTLDTNCELWKDRFQKGAEFGYNKAFVEADKNLKAIVTDFNKANEWHKSDIPTSQINKVVLGYIKDYNSKNVLPCKVEWRMVVWRKNL